MKHAISIVAICSVFALAAAAASIDGKWVSEMTVQRKGEGIKVVSTLDLKSDGTKLTGTITSSAPGGMERKAEIRDGKVNGDKFSFKVVQQMRGQEVTIQFTGKVDGKEMTGERGLEGVNRTQPFTAKKQ